MVLVSTFLFHLLCAISPCDFNQNPPDARISRSYYTKVTADGRPALENEYPIVTTTHGQVQGYSMGTLQEKQIFAFEGIRYGQAPINENRFRAPIPARPWRGIYKAHKQGPMCLQVHPVFTFRVVGSEDCLFLNIYTPRVPPQPSGIRIRNQLPVKKLPVIFYIHGGSFIFGEAGEYGPAYLVDKNVIMVSINYRLGVLGFLSTGDDVSPGNYGLKDQVLAMKWIHQNIEQFGGDPEQVTIMGQSAGAVSVHLHLLSTKSRKYFRSAVSLSASAFQHWSLRSIEQGRRFSKRFAKAAHCPATSSQEMVSCLRRRNPAFIVGNTLKLFSWIVFPPVLFSPVIEPESPTAFISDTPQNLYDRDEVAKYPWICTMTEEEGHLIIYFLLIFGQLGTYRRHFSEFLPVILNYEHIVKNTTEIDARIQRFYLGDESPLNASVQSLARMGTDRFFAHGVTKAIQYHSQVAPTYSYIFSYKGRFNVGKSVFGRLDDELGLAHGEDMFYFFNSTRFAEGFKRNYEEYQITELLTNLISNFAAKGEPVYTNNYGEDLRIWEPVTPTEVQFLEIGNNKNIRMIGNPLKERMKFWESLNLTDMTPFKPRSNILY